VVASCEHLGLLVVRQLEHEVCWKAVSVSLDLLLEALAPSRRRAEDEVVSRDVGGWSPLIG
jgi:hypothetical protein